MALLVTVQIVGSPSCNTGRHVATTHALLVAIARREPCLVLTGLEYNLSKQLSLQHSVRIVAANAGGATLRGVPWQSHRVLSICESCVVELAGLRVVGGNGRRGDGPSAGTLMFGCGGGIVNHGRLRLDRTIVANNIAANAGGLCNWAGAALMLMRSTISHNIATVREGFISLPYLA